MPFLSTMDAQGFVAPDTPKDLGTEFHDRYQGGEPFPHIVIDDFLPAEVLDMCLDRFPRRDEAETQFDRDQERYKASFNPDFMEPALRTLFYSFNSRPFINVLQNITGIKKLVPDPYFLGAGFHEIGQGGHLSMHADFNYHKLMHLERRINVLIYLNKDWKDEYGGQLELWTDDMSRRVHSVVPLFNRCVIFNTTSNSMHGNPNPIAHPEGKTRRSIALYYYTSTWVDDKRQHTTQFKPRAGTGDKIDWAVRRAELIADLTPPLVQRTLRKLKKSENA